MEEKERYVPGDSGEIWYEHWHRYHFALPLAAGRRVADAACGEGYGSALLATQATHVTGIDVAAEVVAMARRRYGQVPNLEFIEGRCESLPLAAGSVDLLVSFETLEHMTDPGVLIQEAARVLGDSGLFVVSTPNKEIYSDARGYRNPFHQHELTRADFETALASRFQAVEVFGQRVDSYSAIWPADREPQRATLMNTDKASAASTGPGLAHPMYWIALCGPTAQVQAAAGSMSLLSDRTHEVQAGVDGAVRHIAELRAYVQRLEAAYLASQEQLASLAKWPRK